MNNKKTVDILVSFCKNPNDFCPTDEKVTFDEKIIYYLALHNKLSWVLKHFVRCNLCRKRITRKTANNIKKYFISAFIFSTLYTDEENKLFKFLRSNKIKAILFKFSSRVDENQYIDKQKLGSDIDFLIAEKDVEKTVAYYHEKGYKKKEYGALKEVQLINTKSNFELDLHFLLAYPHFGDLNLHELAIIKKMSKDTLKLALPHNKVISYPTIEYLLLIKITRFFYNDLLSGIGVLYEIEEFTKSNYKQFDWPKFITLLNKYKITKQTSFVFCLLNNIFGFPTPKKLKEITTIKTKILSHFITKYDIGVYPPISRWNRSKYINEAKNKYFKYTLIKTLLTL